MKITNVFLPMRKGSQRIGNKNTKTFSGVSGGLTYIKLTQLLNTKKVDRIFVSTDDDRVRDIALSFDEERIVIDERPEELAASSTSTDDLINYVPTIIDEGAVLWTHVTSPFIDGEMYDRAITDYFRNLGDFDSLMSVTKIQQFLWDSSGPITYNPDQEKWPRTQTLQPLYEVNSGIFLCDIELYKSKRNRIGENPYFYIMDAKKSLDIDWQDDFDVAEIMWNRYGKI